MAEEQLNVDIIRHTALADLSTLVVYLLQMPTAESVDSLKSVSLSADLAAIGEELGVSSERLSSLVQRLDDLHGELAADEDALHTVRVEHTRLFSQPHNPVIWPYQGLFVDNELALAGKAPSGARMFVSPAASRAERAYHGAGFTLEVHKEPADYVVTQLEFISRLHVAIAQAILAHNDEEKLERVGQLALFKVECMNPWIPRFFERLYEFAKCSVYQSAAEAGKLLVELEGLVDEAPTCAR